jgi:hypothetical protein
MQYMGERKIRRVTSRGTPSYQLGHYVMKGEPDFRHSYFVVEVHLGEYASAEEALLEWPRQIARLRKIGRESNANRLQEKLDRLRELTKEENDG